MDTRAPTRPNTFGSVDQHQRKDWEVVLWFYTKTFVLLVLHDVVVGLIEKQSCQRVKIGVDVTSRSGVFAAHGSRSELTDGQKQVEVVGTNKVLSHRDDGHAESLLAVVVGRML